MRTHLASIGSLCAAAVLVAAACGDGNGTSAPGTDGGAPIVTPPPVTAPVAASGGYAVTSPIDLTALALAPEAAVKNIRLIKGLRDDPAGTFFQLLDEAGIPLVNDLYGVLPGPLKDKVKGWMNEAILGRSHDGRPLPAELDELLVLAESTLVRFDLLTDLDLPVAGAGDTSAPPLARHLFRGIKYDFLGGRLPVVIPRLVDKHTPVNAETSATFKVVTPAPRSDGELELGDHAFGVPYGEYAFAAINELSHQRYGAPLRPALGKLIDCAAMAKAVASKCIGPVCVGHEADLAAICEKGLDRVVEKIHEGIQSYNFNAVRFRRGAAELWDAPTAGGTRDGQADRIAAGVWEALLDVGQGPREVRATFTATRR